MKLQGNIILFDGSRHESLSPLTFTRPVSELRVGITQISEKWERLTGSHCSYHTVDYLSKKYPMKLDSDNFFVDGSVIPDDKLVLQIAKLRPDEILTQDGQILAYRSSEPVSMNEISKSTAFKKLTYDLKINRIQNLWDIFLLNDIVLRDDFARITAGRESQELSKSNQLLNKKDIFAEEGTQMECAIINATTGPVYLGRDSEVMEGSLIRGPFALGENSILKMGAKVYGATTVGPHCKIGGEINNSVFFAYSNKAHDGFIGNSVIGEWCNMGADTNNSNLKNNYSEVKLWNYAISDYQNTGLYFCGLVMGDHSKCGINTMFNTGTVVGVSVNLFGPGFPPNFIPSFSWGGAQGITVYKLERALKTAERVLARRDVTLSDDDKKILSEVFDRTRKYRNLI